MVGTLAAADIVASTMGKKAERKIRKIGEASPTPNHRIANGIHARGERLRKKFTIGRNAFLASNPSPNHNPPGIPVKIPSANPQAPRNIDVIGSVNNRPLPPPPQKPGKTASGAGNA